LTGGVQQSFTSATAGATGPSGALVGAAVFNPSDYATSGGSGYPLTITVVAVIECSVAGQTCQVQLYDFTAGAVISNLTTTNLTQSIVSATLTVSTAGSGTLGTGVHIYNLMLGITAGSTTSPVTCTFAAIEMYY
jgi:hypothetical protein